MKKTATLALTLTAILFASISAAAPYNNLFRVINPEGACQIVRPHRSIPTDAIKDKAYPFGTKVITGADSTMLLLFTATDSVRLAPDTEAIITVEENGARRVDLKKGTVTTRVIATATNDVIVVDTPLGRANSILSNCKVSVENIAATKTDEAKIKVTVTAESASQLKFYGPQYILPQLKNSNSASITATLDNRYTEIKDISGDYEVLINSSEDPDPQGSYEENNAITPVSMSTQSLIKMWRKDTEKSKRPVVSVFAINASGKAIDSFAFVVGRPNIASRTDIALMYGITNALDIAETELEGDAAAGDAAFDDAAAFDDSALESTEESLDEFSSDDYSSDDFGSYEDF